MHDAVRLNDINNKEIEEEENDTSIKSFVSKISEDEEPWTLI